MPTMFRPYCPDQGFQGLLLPPDMRDWLPEGYDVHLTGLARKLGVLC